MRLILALLLLTGTLSADGQPVSYAIPGGYAQIITAKHYKRLVDRSLKAVGRQYRIDSVTAGKLVLKEGQGVQAFNLHNLIPAYARLSGRRNRRRLVDEHFSGLFASIAAQNRIDPDRLDSVQAYLTLRIFPAELVRRQPGSDSLVTQVDAAGTLTVLMLETEGQLIPVQQALLRRWGRPAETVMALAAANVQKTQAAAVLAYASEEASPLDTAKLNDPGYAAGYGLDLSRQSPELVGEMGSVVSLPSKGAISIYKIDRNKPVDIVTFIRRSRAVDQPVPQNPEGGERYFWYYKEKFTPIEVVTGADGTLSVTTPNELSQLLTASVSGL